MRKREGGYNDLQQIELLSSLLLQQNSHVPGKNGCKPTGK